MRLALRAAAVEPLCALCVGARAAQRAEWWRSDRRDGTYQDKGMLSGGLSLLVRLESPHQPNAAPLARQKEPRSVGRNHRTYHTLHPPLRPFPPHRPDPPPRGAPASRVLAALLLQRLRQHATLQAATAALSDLAEPDDDLAAKGGGAHSHISCPVLSCLVITPPPPPLWEIVTPREGVAVNHGS